MLNYRHAVLSLVFLYKKINKLVEYIATVIFYKLWLNKMHQYKGDVNIYTQNQQRNTLYAVYHMKYRPTAYKLS